MDPLSVAASIIACCQAANAATKLCNKLGSLRHASSSLCALSNGIVDVALLVRRIDDLLITHATLNDRGLQLCQNQRENVDALKEHTDRLRTKLLELECLKAYRLQSAHGENKKVAWLRFQIKAERMQASLRQAKLDTSSPLTLLTSSGTLQLQMQVDDIQVVLGKSEERDDKSLEQHKAAFLQAVNPLVESQARSEHAFE